jgi:hypothetical protein
MDRTLHTNLSLIISTMSYWGSTMMDIFASFLSSLEFHYTWLYDNYIQGNLGDVDQESDKDM